MNLRMRNCVLSLATIGLLVGLTTGNAWNFAPANSVSGEAFGVSVNAAGVRVGPTPHVVLPSDGSMVSDQLPNITRPTAAASPAPGAAPTCSFRPTTPTPTSHHA